MKGILTQENLYRIIRLHKRIQRDSEQLYILKELAEGVGSKPTDSLKVQTSLTEGGNKYAEAAADLSMLLDSEVAEIQLLQDKVNEYLKDKDDTLEFRIIQLRYINCYDWQMISNMLGYTDRHIYRTHNKIVAELPVK